MADSERTDRWVENKPWTALFEKLDVELKVCRGCPETPSSKGHDQIWVSQKIIFGSGVAGELRRVEKLVQVLLQQSE